MCRYLGAVLRRQNGHINQALLGRTTETCSSDTCTDGITSNACHPTHCHKRKPPAFAVISTDMTGTWKLLDAGDDRLITIKDTKGQIIITAPNLSCTLDDIQSGEATSLTANSVCHVLTQTSYARETLTLLRIGQDTFLVTAIVTLRNANATFCAESGRDVHQQTCVYHNIPQGSTLI